MEYLKKINSVLRGDSKTQNDRRRRREMLHALTLQEEEMTNLKNKLDGCYTLEKNHHNDQIKHLMACYRNEMNTKLNNFERESKLTAERNQSEMLRLKEIHEAAIRLLQEQHNKEIALERFTTDGLDSGSYNSNAEDYNLEAVELAGPKTTEASSKNGTLAQILEVSEANESEHL